MLIVLFIFFIFFQFLVRESVVLLGQVHGGNDVE